MTLYGPDNRPLTERSTPPDAQLRGGWRYGSSLSGSSTSTNGQYGVDRTTERQRMRSLYYTNGFFGSAVDIAAAFLIGDDFSYGQLDDKNAQIALDEFWQMNDLGALISDRWMVEYFLDGENATVFPLEELDRDTPARIAFLDVHLGVDLTASVQSGVTALSAVDGGNQNVTYDAQQFVWTANSALWNDPRGWPLAMRAADAAQAYTQLLNHRINTHELQSRILGVYSAFVNPNGVDASGKPDGGFYEWQRKADTYRNLPKRGGVLTLAMDQQSGKAEKLDFTTPANGAGNADTDARSLLRLAGLCIGGLPEHWLGEGGNANRATASEMSTPAERIAGRRQATLRSYLNRLFRLELKRRYGPDKRYMLKTSRISADGLTRVTSSRRVLADQLEAPWSLPRLKEESLSELIQMVTVAGRQRLASPQTLAARLSFDSAEEMERFAAIGQTFGVPIPSPGPGGPPDANPINQPA